MENGSCFQLGWGGQGGVRTSVVVSDCDIIRSDGNPAGDAHNRDNNAVIGGVSGTHRSQGYVFENIRAENINHRLFSLNVKPGGEISGFVIRDFTALNWNSEHYHNEFEGDVRNLLFENLRINGRLILDPQAGGFQLNSGAGGFRFLSETEPGGE